jgi:hypothetical protein
MSQSGSAATEVLTADDADNADSFKGNGYDWKERGPSSKTASCKLHPLNRTTLHKLL